jgi:hypothetical protein
MAIERRKSGRFSVRLSEGGVRTTIGTFDTYQEAVEAERRAKGGLQPLRSETEPYRHDYNMPGGATWGSSTADAQKKQEYNRRMGEVADILSKIASGEKLDSDQLKRCAEYTSNLAEDEARFINRRRARSVSIAHARETLMVRRFVEAASVVLRDKIVPQGYATAPPKNPSKRIVNLMISDTHFGARLDGNELPMPYTAVTEARRFAKIIAEARDYKPHYREHTHLNLLINGDIIEGLLLHDLRDGDPLTDQFAAALSMLSQGIGVLAACYPSVSVYWQSGNHDRNKLRHPGRATSSKWDSIGTMLGYSVSMVCKPLVNVTFDIPQTPYCAVPIFDEWIFMTHGDTVLNVGNPGKSLNHLDIDRQMAAINLGRYGKKFSVFACGHVHIGVSVSLGSGHLVINPPLVPSNGFAESLGYNSICGQWLWESVPGYPVGDMRLLKVGIAEDEDESLEKIITPARFSYDPKELK